MPGSRPSGSSRPATRRTTTSTAASVWAGVLLALALALDLAQYAGNIALRWRHARREEKTRGVDYSGNDITLPKRLNRIPYALFALKVALVAAGYVVLLFYLLHALMG